MAILIEAISIFVRVETIEQKYPGGLDFYAQDCPNATFCEVRHWEWTREDS
jgi:hypothetical protein